MKQKFSKFVGLLSIMALFSALGLTACSSNTQTSSDAALTGGVAATVNGKEVMEDDVTNLVQSWRTMNGLSEDDAWGSYLVSINEDIPQFREMMIDSFVAEILVAQAAEEMGISVSDEELDEAVSSMRSNYDSDEAWQSALEQAGTTEEKYRESVYKSMLESKVQEKVAEDAEPVSDEEKLETAQMYASYIDGSRRSSHILFNLEDKETAESVLAQLQNGEIEFEEAAKEYSQDRSGAEGGDVGWDKINNFVTEYAEALAELEVGEMSGLVESQYGYHIIKCTDLFTVPEEGITSIDQLPQELVDIINSELESSAKTTAVSDWYTKYKEEADIVINDMPEGLPYDIDLAPYQAEADAAAAAEGEASSDGLVVETEPVEGETADTEATAEGDAASEDAAAEGETEGDTAEGEATDATTEQPAEISSSAA